MALLSIATRKPSRSDATALEMLVLVIYEGTKIDIFK